MPPGIATTYKPVSFAAVQVPASALLIVESYDFNTPGRLPGSALAYSYHDVRMGVNGAVFSVDGRHSAKFRKTTVTMESDVTAINNVVFCDGHVKGLKCGELTRKGEFWSISGNRDAAGNWLWP
jgi:hypothetical protein